jgi:hypothetical protein
MNTTTQIPAYSNRQTARLLALGGAAMLTLLGLVSFDRAAAGDTDGVYAWQGQGASGRLNDPRFRTTFKKEFPGQTPVIQIAPSKSDILNNLPGKGIVYTNTHGGWSPPDQRPDSLAPKADLLRTGPPGTPDNAITAQDLLALRNRVGDDKMPGLMAIGGCDVLKHAPPDSNPLTIADALGVSNGKPGRALIAFDQKIVGPGADDFMLWVLDNWCHRDADGKYPTLQQAMDNTMKFIEDYQAAHKDDPAYQYGGKQKDDFMGGNAHYLGEHAQLIGDPNLKATDVLKGLPPEGGDTATQAPTDGPVPSPTPESAPSPADNSPASPSPGSSPSPEDNPPASAPPSDSPASPSPESETVPLSTPPSPVPSPSPSSSSSALPGQDPGWAPSPGTTLLLPRYFPAPMGAPLPPWARGYDGGAGYRGGYAGGAGYRGCVGGAGGCGGQSGGGCAGGSGCVGGSAGGCGGAAGGTGFSGSHGSFGMGGQAGRSGQMSPLGASTRTAGSGKGQSGLRTGSPSSAKPGTTLRASPPQRNAGATSSSRVATRNPHEGTKGSDAAARSVGRPTPANKAAGSRTANSGRVNNGSARQAANAASRTPTSRAAKPAPRASSPNRAPAARPAPAQRRATPDSRAPSTRVASRAPRASSSAGRSGGSHRK